MKHFPSWRYHKEKDAVIINSELEETALGAGWVESPAEFCNALNPVINAAPVIEQMEKPKPKRGRQKADA